MLFASGQCSGRHVSCVNHVVVTYTGISQNAERPHGNSYAVYNYYVRRTYPLRDQLSKINISKATSTNNCDAAVCVLFQTLAIDIAFSKM